MGATMTSTLRPSDVPHSALGGLGIITGTLGRAEAEAAAAILVRWHHAKGHTDWTPVSRAELAAWLGTDHVVRDWARNPFWRPAPWELVAGGYVVGWGTVDEPGTVTPKFIEALGRSPMMAREGEPATPG